MSDHQNTRPFAMSRCSTIGPRLSAGKNVNAPTITITLTRSAVKSGVVTGNVPSEAGICFLRLKLPAMASGGMIMKNRPNSMATASVVLYHLVFALRPPNAEPLLFAIEVNAYVISDKPCGPVFASEFNAKPDTIEMPVNVKITRGTARM